MDPLNGIFGDDTGYQTGMEAFWHLTLTRNILVTPGIQLLWNPPWNPEANFVAMPHIKFRVQI
jgi:carbohydrate-selective porin OprB